MLARNSCYSADDDGAQAVEAESPARAGMVDNSPRPHLRGHFRGFLPAGTVAALRRSAASGNGLALVPPSPASAHVGNGAGWLVLVAALAFIAGRGAR